MNVYIERCSFCGSTEFIEAKQAHVSAHVTSEGWFGQQLNHTLCRNCGSVVRSYVNDPEALLEKKNRRTKE